MTTEKQIILTELEVDNTKARFALADQAKALTDTGKKTSAAALQTKALSKQYDLSVGYLRKFARQQSLVGIGAKDQARALAEIAKVAAQTGKPIAVVAKAYEGLSKVLQNADEAIDNLGDAMRFQARSGIPQAEKAAAQYAETIGGGTNALRDLGAAGAAYLRQLDKIADADTKARLTAELTRKELNRQRDSVEKLGDKLRVLGLRLQASLGPTNLATLKVLGRGLKTLAVAGFGALVGAAGLAMLAVKKFGETDVRVKRSVDALKKATDALVVAFGSALVGGSKNATKALGEMADQVKQLTTWVNENREAIHGWARAVVSTLGSAIAAGVKLVLGLRLAYAAVVDTVELTIAGVAATTVGVMKALKLISIDVRNSLSDMVLMITKTADAVGAGGLIPKAMRQFGNSLASVDFSNVDAGLAGVNARLAEGFKNVNGILAEADAFDKLVESLKSVSSAAVDLAKTRGKGGGGDDNILTFPVDLDEGIANMRESVRSGLQDVSDAWAEAAERMKAVDLEGVGLDFFYGEGASDAVELHVQQLKSLGNAFSTAGNAALAMGNSLASAFGKMAAGSGKMADLKNAVLATVGEMAGMFADLAMAEGTALLFTPGGQAFGAGLIAAGLVLRGLAAAAGARSSMGGSRGSAGGGAGAATQAPTTNRRTELVPQRAERTVILRIGDREYRADMTDDANDDQRRRRRRAA